MRSDKDDSPAATRGNTLADALEDHFERLENPLANLSAPTWADSISINELQELGVLRDLNDDQQRKLTALIARCWEFEAVVHWTLPHRQKRQRWQRQGAG